MNYRAFRRCDDAPLLERKNLVFSALRMPWDQDVEAQPVLTLLMALFRDSKLAEILTAQKAVRIIP